MNIDPLLYDRSNFLQKRDANDLIERIVKDYKYHEIGNILDVGCGTGNITFSMSQQLKPKSIVAIDISPPMIEFAKSNYNFKSINYFTGDICDDWSMFEGLCDAKEKSIDIVTSIYCLHWVCDKSKAMQNIGKFLKPGGMCYILLFAWSDLLPVQQKITEHPKWEKFFKVNGMNNLPFSATEAPNEQNMLQFWQELCTDYGFQVQDTVYTHTNYTFSNLKDFHAELKALCHFLPYIPKEHQNEFLSDYYELVNNEYVIRFANNSRHDSIVKLNYDYITVVAKKNN